MRGVCDQRGSDSGFCWVIKLWGPDLGLEEPL